MQLSNKFDLNYSVRDLQSEELFYEHFLVSCKNVPLK